MELLFPILLLALLVPMFLGIRRQKREADKLMNMQTNLKVGDSVITTSGLYGTVVEADESSVDLEIAEEVVTTWLRQAIREVRVDDADAGETDADHGDSVDEVSVDTSETGTATEIETENKLSKD